MALVTALAFVALRTGPLAPVKVPMTEVKKGRVSPAIFGIGQVEAQRSWMVGPSVAGRVLSAQVDVGQAVQPGQLAPWGTLADVSVNQNMSAQAMWRSH